MTTEQLDQLLLEAAGESYADRRVAARSVLLYACRAAGHTPTTSHWDEGARIESLEFRYWGGGRWGKVAIKLNDFDTGNTRALAAALHRSFELR